MKAIKLMATVDEQGSLSLDQPLSLIENSRVEVIILIPETVDIRSYLKSDRLYFKKNMIA